MTPVTVHRAAARAWPEVSDRVRELFRAGADLVLHAPPEWLRELDDAVLAGERLRVIAADPLLSQGLRRSNQANLRHWAVANVQRPAERVPASEAREVLDVSRDLVRRGLDEDALDSYRIGQGAAWRRWMQVCFALTRDADELQALLDVSSLSISTFLEDTMAAISRQLETEREQLLGGTHGERRSIVALLLEGAPVSRTRAEAVLGYGLSGPHTAAVVWGHADTRPADLERAAEAVRAGADAPRRLTVVAGAAALWLWLPVSAPVGGGALAAELDRVPGVRVAVGRAGRDLDGFRRSHLDAVATQQLLARLGGGQRLVRYDDVQLTALVTADAAAAEELVQDVLGDLRTADAATRDTVLTWVRTAGSTSRTAQLLHTHRNTVVRRLARAEQLLPRPLQENLLGVAVALEVLRWSAL